MLHVLRVPASEEAPSRAREAVRAVSDFLSPDQCDRAMLVLSELVTNSVRHSGAGRTDVIDVRLESRGDALRLAVADPGQGFTEDRPAVAPGPAGGWGLDLVGQLSDRWWVESDSRGCRVVAELG